MASRMRRSRWSVPSSRLQLMHTEFGRRDRLFFGRRDSACWEGKKKSAQAKCEKESFDKAKTQRLTLKHKT
jgi:hypothetical protein